VPDTINVPEVITDSLNEDCDYYRVEDIHVCELINKEFIEAFVKKGTVMLTAGDKLTLIKICKSELNDTNAIRTVAPKFIFPHCGSFVSLERPGKLVSICLRCFSV
jgi:hypothetical protein